MHGVLNPATVLPRAAPRSRAGVVSAFGTAEGRAALEKKRIKQDRVPQHYHHTHQQRGVPQCLEPAPKPGAPPTPTLGASALSMVATKPASSLLALRTHSSLGSASTTVSFKLLLRCINCFWSPFVPFSFSFFLPRQYRAPGLFRQRRAVAVYALLLQRPCTMVPIQCDSIEIDLCRPSASVCCAVQVFRGRRRTRLACSGVGAKRWPTVYVGSALHTARSSTSTALRTGAMQTQPLRECAEIIQGGR